MSTEDIMTTIEDIVNANSSVSIPGLELEDVVRNFVEEKYGDVLKDIEDETEREALREQWTSYYTKGGGRNVILMEINTIKSNFVAVRDGLEAVLRAVTLTTASNAIPSVITVGTATSTPNPAYILIENSQKKETLLAMTKAIGNNVVNLLRSAVNISFPIPSEIETIIETYKTVLTAINTIPV